MYFVIGIILILVLCLAAVTRFYLRGADLSRFDTPVPPVTFDAAEMTPAMKGVNAYLAESFTMGETLVEKRKRFESVGLARIFECEFRPDRAVFEGIEVPGEWTLVDGADPSRRLLYLHGGAFTVGSPVSHRAITHNIAVRTGCAVFAADYRLMPENPRMASIHDSRAAYQWLMENGPDGAGQADKIAVAGDSAGGNLTLCLSNWARDVGVRQPDAVIALSPATDSALTSPSIRGNADHDIMLRPIVKPFLKIPHWLLMWLGLKINRIAPASPLISPVRDNLAGLPPTLVHVSTTEVLYDDARRYTNKALAQGSPVVLQSWAHMCHVWHIFDESLPEAHAALDEIAAFMKQHGVAKAAP